MKRMTYFVMALALVLGLSQCKKEQPSNQNDSEGVHITLNVGDDNSKVVVTPGFTNSETGETYAKVEFEEGDVIYVGNNSAYCGYLEYHSSSHRFEGNVEPTSEADYLHFYFMGNQGTTAEPTSALSITDQTSKYPVISYAHSTQKYRSGVTAYSAKLQNYCSIVKFTTTNIDADITITGMNNIVAVNFAANNAADGTGINNNPYTVGKDGDGEITLHIVSNTERWAILLPQSQVTTAMAFASGYATKSAFTVPEVTANMYHNTGVAVNLVAGNFFRVSASKVVQFSSGNLQYKSGSGYRFAPNQYDYKGAWNTSDYVDLFGWGKWGAGQDPLTLNNHSWTNDFQGTLDGYSDWYTLTSGEWDYLFNHNTYGQATVNNIHGVIILPLGSSLSISTGHSGWNDNTINASTWKDTYQAAGAVFLPAAGYREEGTTDCYAGENEGNYWSKSGETGSSHDLEFRATGGAYVRKDIMSSYGFSVRLVR